jgi:hypothetical protein
MTLRQQAIRRAATVVLAVAAAGCASAERPVGGSSSARPEAIALALQQDGAVGGFVLTPLRIEEDSRCPAQVQCIQAGTVRLSVRIAGPARRQPVLILNRPSRLDSGAWLTLCAATPYPVRPGRIRPSAYRFGFVLARGSQPPSPACPNPAPATGG